MTKLHEGLKIEYVPFICNMCGKEISWHNMKIIFDVSCKKPLFCTTCYERILIDINEKCIHKFLDESSVTSNAI